MQHLRFGKPKTTLMLQEIFRKKFKIDGSLVKQRTLQLSVKVLSLLPRSLHLGVANVGKFSRQNV